MEIKGQTILVKDGVIKSVKASPGKYVATKTIDADGKLVTPGFVNTHIHLTDDFGDYDKAPARLSEDSIPYYRKKLSDTYLPYPAGKVQGELQYFHAICKEVV